MRAHCPACGSINLIARPSFDSTRLIAEATPARMMICSAYGCRRCGTRFDEYDRLKCEAPSLQYKSMAEKRQFEEAQDNLKALQNPEQRQELLKKLLFKPKKDGESDGKSEG